MDRRSPPERPNLDRGGGLHNAGCRIPGETARGEHDVDRARPGTSLRQLPPHDHATRTSGNADRRVPDAAARRAATGEDDAEQALDLLQEASANQRRLAMPTDAEVDRVAGARRALEVDHARPREQIASGGADVKRHHWSAQSRTRQRARLDDPERIDPPYDLAHPRRIADLPRDDRRPSWVGASDVDLVHACGDFLARRPRHDPHVLRVNADAGRSAPERDDGEAQPTRRYLAADLRNEKVNSSFSRTPGPPACAVPDHREPVGRCVLTNAVTALSGSDTRQKP